MTNFEFLANIHEYALFSSATIEAEKVYSTSPAMCAVGCRKALELAVKWVYSADRTITMPYKDNLQSLIHEPSFRFALDSQTWGKLPFIIRLGNLAVHTERAVNPADFLYLNNDIVNSIISQAEQGLITEFMNESENSSGKAFDKETKIGALARISSTFYRFFGAEAELDYEHTRSNSTQDNHVSKDIVQKTLHDAAYNIAYDYISNQLNKSQVEELGEYVEITGDFQYIDFKTLVSYFRTCSHRRLR